MLVGLLEVSGRDSRAEDEAPFVGDLLAGEQAQEVALAGAVVAEHGDPFAERHLEVERPHQTGNCQPVAGQHTYSRATTAQTDAHVLAARSLGGRAGLLEFAEPRDRRLKTAGHRVTDRRLDPHPA